MANLNRRKFLGNAASTLLEEKDSPKQFEYKDPSNKTLPRGLSKTSTTTAQYTGVWGETQMAHLLRRTMFGATKSDIDFFKTKNMRDSVDYLLNVPTTAPTPPLNHYTTATVLDPNVPLGQTWVNANEDGALSGYRRQSLKAWWIGLQLNQERNIREKMTMFWHNLFATESNVVQYSKFFYKHHSLLRANCLGNLKSLVRMITIDPAMLIYLNGYKNTKTAPDENYSRELQELFTIGKDLPNHYTEDDVKQAARVLTGWRINNTSYTSYFDINTHDTGNKQFSSFYNNTQITGRTGSTAGDLELDDMLSMIFSNQEVSKYICRKIYRFFVYYVIDSTVETNIITPLATILRNNNYDIKPVILTLLKSEHFFDVLNMSCMIKTPTDFIAGMSRQMNIQFPPASNVATQYSHWLYATSYSTLLGQDLGDPPDVAGWPAYYQEPQFYELWINSDSLPKRNLLCDTLIYTGYNRNSFKLIFDCIAFANIFSDPSDPNKLIDEMLKILYAIDVSSNTKAMLKTSFLLSGQLSDSYWTTAWNDYKSNPTDTAKKATVNTRLQGLLKYIMGQAEFQLC